MMHHRILQLFVIVGIITLCISANKHHKKDDDKAVSDWLKQARAKHSKHKTGDNYRFQSIDKIGAPKKIGMVSTKGLAKKITTKANTKCVICQYLVERIRGEMLMNGLSGGVPFGNGPPLVGVPRFSAGGMSSNVASPANMFTPPVGGQVGGANSFIEEEEQADIDDDAFISENEDNDSDAFIQLADEKKPPIFPKTKKQQNMGIRRNFYLMKHLKKSKVPYPRHDRMLNLRHWGPVQTRYADMYDGPLRAARRAQERFENNQMYTVIYDVLNQICSGMPPPFYQYCAPIIRNYQKVGEGLRYKDRPDAICMHIDACDKKSYIRESPHALLSK